jgi:phospholipase/carboxylesterase
MQQQVYKEERSKLDYLLKDNQAKKAFFVFHGYGASMYDLYGLNDVISTHHEYDWYFPNGPMPLMMGSMMSRAWFPIDVERLEQAMNNGTFRTYAQLYPPEFVEAIDLCEQFINSLSKKYDDIYIAGFSQGSMLATHLTFTRNIKVRALVNLSSTLIGKDRLLESESINQNLPFFQSHGENDPILSYEHAKDLFELLKLNGHTGEFVSFKGAHEIPSEVINKWDGFMKKLSS